MDQTAVNPEAWANAQGAGSGVTTQMLDQIVITMHAAREMYETAKAESTRLYNEYAELEGKVIEALHQAGKTKYVVEGLGTVSLISKFVVPTPKTIEQKKAFFDYLRNTHGETVFWDKVGVNHMTLQTIYNSDMNEALEGGNAAFKIPGLDDPTAMQSLRLTKERKK